VLRCRSDGSATEESEAVGDGRDADYAMDREVIVFVVGASVGEIVRDDGFGAILELGEFVEGVSELVEVDVLVLERVTRIVDSGDESIELAFALSFVDGLDRVESVVGAERVLFLRGR